MWREVVCSVREFGMTDQEINEAVARKLGWFKNDLGGWEHPSEIETREDHLGVFRKHVHRESIPDYCHSIEAAWEVVEFLTDQEIECEISFTFKNLWRCRFASTEIYGQEEVAKAICLAFLKCDVPSEKKESSSV